MKKSILYLSIIVALTILAACGSKTVQAPFNHSTERVLRPDCSFTVEVINSIPNTEMNLVTVKINCSEREPLSKRINALCPKTEQLVIGQPVNIIIVDYQLAEYTTSVAMVAKYHKRY